MEYEYDPQMEQAWAFRLLHGLRGKYRLWKGYLTMAVDNVFDEDVEINGNKETDNYIYYGMPRFFKTGYEIAF